MESGISKVEECRRDVKYASSDVNSDAFKWKQYFHLCDLYKAYLTLMINLGGFSFATIGGVTSYVLSEMQEGRIERFGLFFPYIFSVGLCLLFVVSIKPAFELRDKIKLLGKELNVVLIPHVYLLVFGIILLFVLYFVVSLALLFIAMSVQ